MCGQIVIWPVPIRINPSLCRKEEAFKMMSLEQYQWTGSKIMKFTPKTPKYGLYIKVCSSIWVKRMYTPNFQKWITFPKVNILSHISYGHGSYLTNYIYAGLSGCKFAPVVVSLLPTLLLWVFKVAFLTAMCFKSYWQSS